MKIQKKDKIQNNLKSNVKIYLIKYLLIFPVIYTSLKIIFAFLLIIYFYVKKMSFLLNIHIHSDNSSLIFHSVKEIILLN